MMISLRKTKLYYMSVVDLREGPGWLHHLNLGKKEITEERKASRASKNLSLGPPPPPQLKLWICHCFIMNLQIMCQNFSLCFSSSNLWIPTSNFSHTSHLVFFCPFSICKLNGCFCEFWTVHFFKKCELKSYLTSNCYAFHQLHYVISCELTGDLFPRCLTN